MDIRFCDLDNMIVFANDSSGRLVYVDDVANGYACNCFCINCNSKLNAKNNGSIKAHHFAHAAGSDCKKGHEDTISFFIKRILEKNGWMLLPKGLIKIDDEPINDYQTVQVVKVGLKEVEGYPRAVVATTKKGIDIGIYIDFVNDDWIARKYAYRGLFNNLIEIDLRRYRNSEIPVEKELEKLLCHRSGCVKWIKRYDETIIANKVQELSIWKTFGSDPNGVEHIYCPRLKQTTTTIAAECDFCKYRTKSILKDYYERGCIGFIESELSVGSIMKAQKPDYSSVESPSFVEMNSIYKGGHHWFYLKDLPIAYPDTDFCLIYDCFGENVYLVNLKSFRNDHIVGLRINENGTRSNKPSYLLRGEQFRSWRKCVLTNYSINDNDIDFIKDFLQVD